MISVTADSELENDMRADTVRYYSCRKMKADTEQCYNWRTVGDDILHK